VSAINKIFVTGATGNQGGATVKNLLDKGFCVKALIRNPVNAKLHPHKNLEIIKGDLNETSFVISFLNMGLKRRSNRDLNWLMLQKYLT
jgi:nucleoside-diphosphate-sugar epimerase